jgi:hypothetical protein
VGTAWWGRLGGDGLVGTAWWGRLGEDGLVVGTAWWWGRLGGGDGLVVGGRLGGGDELGDEDDISFNAKLS